MAARDKVENFSICMEFGDRGIAFAGQVVSGTVMLSISENLGVSNIRLALTGRAKTGWIEKDQLGIVADYEAEEFYLDHQLIFTDNIKIDDEGHTVILQGGHKFPFSFTLPTSCPSTFEGSFGSIRYYATAILQLQDGKQMKTLLVFTVIGKVDLNLDSSAALPVETMGKQGMGHAGLKSLSFGETSCTLKLPYGGYSPGQLLSVSMIIKSSTKKRRIKLIRLELLQAAEYVGQTKKGAMDRIKHRQEDRLVGCKELSEEMATGEMKVIDCTDFAIPSVCPVLRPCGIIYVSYRLKASIQASGASNCIQLELPLTIGSVPLEKPFISSGRRQSIQLVKFSKSHTVNLVPTISDCFWSMYNAIPTPTVEDCIFGPVDVREDNEDFICSAHFYTPKYPVFKK